MNICKEVSATDYYTGPAAKDYMDETLFNQKGINVHYFEYAGYEEYEQLYPPFEHGVSIVDLIFCQGKNARNFLKSNKKNG